MKATVFGISIAISLPMHVYSAALETSNQSIASFLQSNHYVEFSTAIVDANVSGHTDRPTANHSATFTETSTQDFVHDYVLSNAALKLQIQPNWSFGIIYDQPFGANLGYALAPIPAYQNTLINAVRLKMDTHNLSTILGYQPNTAWNFYTGLSHQTLKTHLKISGQLSSIVVDYMGETKTDAAQGWLTGISYQIPEYAFKTSITYRSKIRHKSLFHEQTNSNPTVSLFDITSDQNTTIETPQSVNIELQSAITSHSLLYGSLRWVNWQNFKIVSPLISSDRNPLVTLVDYQNDQWSSTLGFAYRLNEHWTSTLDVGWDSGTGNAASALNPSDGFYSIGLGGFYHFNTHLFIAGGIKYFQLNPAKASPNQNRSDNFWGALSSVNNNNAVAYGIKVGYRF